MKTSINHCLHVFVLGAAVLFTAACTVKEGTDLINANAVSTVFRATIEQACEQGTKVYADENLKVLWNEDDRVSIFDKNTYNRQFKFDGQTGDNSGSFSVVESGDYIIGNELSVAYAVYPYNEATTISNEGVISLTLPATQKYSPRSFGIGANTMVAATGDNLLVFKNLCGYLMIKLYGEGLSVSSLKLEGKGGELLAGAATVSMAPDGVPSVSVSEGGTTAVILNCETPVALGADAEHYTEFWFALPPVTFANGFKLTVSLSDGGCFKKETNSQITIKRNTRGRMSAVQVVPIVPEAVDLGLWSKWANFNVGAFEPEDSGYYYAWGELEPKSVYSWETYKWSNLCTKYNDEDNLKVLEEEDDVAHVLWGDNWHMPTEDDYDELINGCTWDWVAMNGVRGYKVTGPNGNSIFLPAPGRMRDDSIQNSGMGYYWNTSLGTYYGTGEAGCMRISEYSVKQDSLSTMPRKYGGLVRPVYGVGSPYLTILEQDSEISLQKTGDEAVLHISSNQHWRSELLDFDEDWLAIAEGAEGEGDGLVRLVAQGNTGVIRFATLVILNRYGKVCGKYSITQDGDCYLAVESEEIHVGWNQEEQTISVKSSSEWTVRKQDDADVWYSVSTPDGSNGNAVIRLVFDNNLGDTVRESKVIIATVPSQEGAYVAQKEIVVKQGYRVTPERHLMDNEEMLNWNSDWTNAPVYTEDYGTLFTAKARLNRNSPFGTYTFRWKDLAPDPNAEDGLRIRHWFCFPEACELKFDIRPVDGKISFDFNTAGDGNKPSLSAYYDVDWTQPIEITYKFESDGVGFCHVSYLVNGTVIHSFNTSENLLRSVTYGSKINIYFGVDRSGSAVLDWYEYTPPVDWGD